MDSTALVTRVVMVGIATCGAATGADMPTPLPITAMSMGRAIQGTAIRTSVPTRPGSTAAPKRSGLSTCIITGLTITGVGDSCMGRRAFLPVLGATETAMALVGATGSETVSASAMGAESNTSTTAIAEHNAVITT